MNIDQLRVERDAARADVDFKPNGNIYERTAHALAEWRME